MSSYLEKKGIKFADERLNHAINVIALAKGGEKKLNLLFDKLTPEAIQVIDSKKFIDQVPIKEGYSLTTYITNYNDSSYLSTHQILEIERDGRAYSYDFNMSYFHSKCYISDGLGSFYEAKKEENSDGDYENVMIDNTVIDYGVVSKADSSLLKCEGLYTVKKENYTFARRISVKLDDLFGDIRETLKDREYYKELDRETIRKYYPSLYNFYNSEACIDYYDFKNDLAFIYDSNFNSRNDKYGYSNELIYYMEEEGQYLQKRYLSKFLTYDGWCSANNVKMEEPMPYSEWVNMKDDIEKIDISVIEKIPSLNVDNKQDISVYSIYNPNKIRYEDEEEEEQIVKRR